ncbi:terpene synthase family protein [Nocardia colli]|uniref:terpene synthase family protein n=1 Tax=Nocardia colli TaxID=2545717 RepID=UPI0035DE3AB2
MKQSDLSMRHVLEDIASMDELPVYSPVPMRVHPVGIEAADAFSVEWILRHGMAEPNSRDTRANMGLFVAPGYPPAASAESVKAITCYFQWGLLWDDYLETLMPDLSKVVLAASEANRVFLCPSEDPIPADDVWLNSLRDLRNMLDDCLTQAGTQLVLPEHLVWVGGEVWKCALQLRPELPDVDEFLRMRWFKSGPGILAAMTGPACGYTLTAEEYHMPLMRAFTRAVYAPLYLYNDVLSMAKELPKGQSDMNIVSALARTHDLSPAEAFTETFKLIERMMMVIEPLQRKLLRHPSPAVVQYAKDLPLWMPATLAFTSTSARYLETVGSDGVEPLRLPKITFVDTPIYWDPTDHTPPPYPEISWWWSLLDD